MLDGGPRLFSLTQCVPEEVVSQCPTLPGMRFLTHLCEGPLERHIKRSPSHMCPVMSPHLVNGLPIMSDFSNQSKSPITSKSPHHVRVPQDQVFASQSSPFPITQSSSH